MFEELTDDELELLHVLVGPVDVRDLVEHQQNVCDRQDDEEVELIIFMFRTLLTPTVKKVFYKMPPFFLSLSIASSLRPRMSVNISSVFSPGRAAGSNFLTIPRILIGLPIISSS